MTPHQFALEYIHLQLDYRVALGGAPEHLLSLDARRLKHRHHMSAHASTPRSGTTKKRDRKHLSFKGEDTAPLDPQTMAYLLDAGLADIDELRAALKHGTDEQRQWFEEWFSAKMKTTRIPLDELDRKLRFAPGAEREQLEQLRRRKIRINGVSLGELRDVLQTDGSEEQRQWLEQAAQQQMALTGVTLAEVQEMFAEGGDRPQWLEQLTQEATTETSLMGLPARPLCPAQRKWADIKKTFIRFRIGLNWRARGYKEGEIKHLGGPGSSVYNALKTFESGRYRSELEFDFIEPWMHEALAELIADPLRLTSKRSEGEASLAQFYEDLIFEQCTIVAWLHFCIFHPNPPAVGFADVLANPNLVTQSA